MKTLVLILLFVSISLSTSANASYSGFFPPNNNSIEYRNYLRGLARAKANILQGTAQLNDYAVTFGAKVIEALEKANILVSTDVESENACQRIKDRGAFVNLVENPTAIFICQTVRENISYESEQNVNILSQMLVHEGVHLAGDTNECNASYFEISVMKNTSMGVQSRQNLMAYNPKCNFKL